MRDQWITYKHHSTLLVLIDPSFSYNVDKLSATQKIEIHVVLILFKVSVQE